MDEAQNPLLSILEKPSVRNEIPNFGGAWSLSSGQPLRPTAPVSSMPATVGGTPLLFEFQRVLNQRNGETWDRNIVMGSGSSVSWGPGACKPLLRSTKSTNRIAPRTLRSQVDSNTNKNNKKKSTNNSQEGSVRPKMQKMQECSKCRNGSMGDLPRRRQVLLGTT